MKKYIKPTMTGELFTANEFVSACGDSGVTYKFKCNAGSKYSKYNVYLENGDPYCTSEEDYGGIYRYFWDYFHPCDGEHEADSDSGFLKGYMYEQDRDGDNTGKKIDVIIWTEDYTNCHCTKDLDITKWETAKS